MDASPPADTCIPSDGAVVPPRSEGPLRLLCLAALWLFAALLVAPFLANFAVGFVVGVHNGAVARGGPVWRLSPLATIVVSGVATEAVLLLASWRRALVVGQGSRAAGLGSFPLRRRWLLAGLAAVGVVCVIAWAAFLSHLLVRPPPTAFGAALARGMGTSSPVLVMALLLIVTGLAPLCEELFFRGWLWTGLRRHWGAVPVAVATALPWLIVHAGDGGVIRPLFLIPSAILFSLARHLCGGVRASLVLHLLNNCLAVGAVLLAMLLRNH